MAERPRIPLPFGGGLDRESGVAVVEPTSFEDLRNVLLYRGKAKFRLGMETISTMVGYSADNPDRVIAIHPMRQLNEGLAVGYSSASERVYVNLIANDGDNPTLLQSGLTNKEWFTNPVAADPPHAILTDSYGLGFLAHDQPQYQYRAETYYYNPADSPVLKPLTADLARTGTPVAMKFRGVARHLNYVFGWGYGTSADPNRPEIVRASVAGSPLDWDPESYFIAGQRNEPVTTCVPAGNVLLVFKETETYQIFGYSKQTFGIRPSDPLFGCVSGRLAVAVSGTVYFWSFAGPRMSNGGPSVDLATPLGLDEETLSTLPTESNAEDAFAVYDHVSRAVLFVFGSRVYALHMRDPQRMAWTYYEFKDHTASPTPTLETLACGGTLYVVTGIGAVSGAPTGYATLTSVESTATATELRVTWANVNSDGNEFVEVWAKDVDNAGSYSQVGGVMVNGQANQSLTLTGLNVLCEYDIAIRYRRSAQYGTGYTDSDPANWTATALGDGITSGAAPANPSFTWNRTGTSTERVTVTWTNVYTTSGINIQIYRNGVLVTTETNNTASSQTYQDTGITGETTAEYELRYVRYTDNVGASVEGSEWCGPNPQPTIMELVSAGAAQYSGVLELGDATAYTEVWDDSPGTLTLYTTLNPGTTMFSRNTGLTSGTLVIVRVRHKKTAYTTDDFSDWSYEPDGYVNIT